MQDVTRSRTTERLFMPIVAARACSVFLNDYRCELVGTGWALRLAHRRANVYTGLVPTRRNSNESFVSRMSARCRAVAREWPGETGGESRKRLRRTNPDTNGARLDPGRPQERPQRPGPTYPRSLGAHRVRM